MGDSKWGNRKKAKVQRCKNVEQQLRNHPAPLTILALLALTINKEGRFMTKGIYDDDVRISTAVFNIGDERMYLSEEHFENLKMLQNMLVLCFKSTEKKGFLKDIGIDNVKTLFYENFKNEVYANIKLFFKFIKENFSYITKRMKEEKKKNNLKEEDYLSDQKLLDLLEDVISYDIEKNASYFEKLVQFMTLRKCFTISFSMNLDNTDNPIVLITEVDSRNNHVHFRVNNNLPSGEEEEEQQQQERNYTKKSSGSQKDKVPFLQSIINPIKSNSFVMKMTRRMNHPMGYFRNLCTKHNFQVASENWVEYFYNHNETLCHVETCGSGDCLFLSLQYLLDKNGVRTNNVIPNVGVPESSFVPWYVRNVKQTDDPKFNVNDLRYISTFYFIKFFPGYTEDYELDEQYINERFNLLINLEFTNYYLKKDYLHKVMRGNKVDDKNNKSVLLLISDYINKYLFFGGRPPITNMEEAAALCTSNVCKKGNADGAGPSGGGAGGGDGSGTGTGSGGGSGLGSGSGSGDGSGDGDGSGSGDGSGGGSGLGSGSGSGDGGGLSNEKRGGGPIGDGDYTDDDVSGGKSKGNKSGSGVGGARKKAHRSSIRRTGSSGNMDSDNESTGIMRSDLSRRKIKSTNDFQSVMQENPFPLSSYRSEQSLNTIGHYGNEFTRSTDDIVGISRSSSPNEMLEEEDDMVHFEKVGDKGKGKKFTKDTHFRVTYGHSPSSTTTMKHDPITLSLKTDSSNGSQFEKDRRSNVMKNQSLRIASRESENSSLMDEDMSTLKYTDKKKNMEMLNAESTSSLKGEYEHVIVPHGADSENSKAIDVVRPKRYLTNQGVLYGSSKSNPKKSDMRLALIENEKKYRMQHKAITESTESTDATEGNENENENDEEYDSSKIEDLDSNTQVTDYDEILEELHEGGYRFYELIFFKLVSLSANKMTYDELKKVKRKNIHTLIGTNLKSRVIGSHVFMKKITQGTILPFFNYVNIKNKLNNVNRKQNYANPDLYVVIMKTTFNKKIRRRKDGLVTKSLLFKHNGDCISYWSIKNNDYHFTCDNKVIETKTIEEKASAFFYERTRTGHIHWGDETDYEGFQKMFSIGLITFINNNTKFFFPRNTFKDYPVYFLIYFYSGVHFEPGIHISMHNDREVCRSSYERTRIPHSFQQVPKE
ncbi:hypothetical protein PCYB_121320 [Plasmodium cynomolgi strain B]|uniref:OTU domain-containing protein n=1 Tax=Plasmodium cynomolgi (strain B) TaxID=1120755 RepID=K6UVK9_PLACD|nr:hypothetical protein PCYB_121320 [Plasmodium cynomolgi strain B]GAB67564.1 hypothetical protein PCYB_121320 [Plasmodium cynomolgi strain B]